MYRYGVDESFNLRQFETKASWTVKAHAHGFLPLFTIHIMMSCITSLNQERAWIISTLLRVPILSLVHLSHGCLSSIKCWEMD